MEFLGNVFYNFIFEIFISHEALVTGRVTPTSNNQMQLFTVSSHNWQKLFQRYTQLWLFPKQIICQSYFTFQIVFINWIWFVNSFNCVSDGNVWPPGQRWNTRKNCFWIITENLYNVLRLQDMWVTVVMKHLRKMFRTRIHKAAECNTTARINWDKTWNQFLRYSQTFCYWDKQHSADSNIIQLHLTLKSTKNQSSGTGS